jgi:hypothetical protein
VPKTSVKTCRIKGCGRYVDANGLCRPHRHREKQYGKPEAGPPLPPKIGTRVPCKVPGCPNFATATKGLCHAHHMRLKRNGNVGLKVPLRLPRGKAAHKAAEAPHYCVIDRDLLEYILVKLDYVKIKLKSGTTILFADDYEVEAWKAIEASRPVPSEWVLKVPHHGSAHHRDLRGIIDRMKNGEADPPQGSNGHPA